MPVYLMGDVHGQFDKLIDLLRSHGLITANHSWAGADSSLIFLGDYFDRGPHGLEVVDLIMNLQVGAALAGGKVEALLGNHDVMLLAAKQIGNVLPAGAELPLRYLWQQNGGRKRDLEGLTEDHIAWLTELPAMMIVGDTLLQHADSTFYAEYGSAVESINGGIYDVLHSDEYELWAELIVAFIRRMEFLKEKGGSVKAASDYLRRMGASQLVHGHTPIPMIFPEKNNSPVTAAWTYAEGLCTNIDGGMFLGEAGFIYELPAETSNR
jgi:hypothetical protein